MFRITLEDFQCYRKAVLEVKGFVVLTGLNNRGKSAVVRAFRGVFSNPRGCLRYVRRGTSHFSVTLEGPSGSVMWSRGEGLNTYRVNDTDFHRVGQAVPEEVHAIGGVRPLPAGTGEVWPQIGEQFTGQVFLLDRSGSALAEAMADVSRVGVLNTALRASNRDHRQAVERVKLLAGEKTEREKEVDALGGSLPLLAEIESLRVRRGQLEELRRLREALAALKDRRAASARALDALRGLLPPAFPNPDGVRATLARLEGAEVLLRRRATALASPYLTDPPAAPDLGDFPERVAALTRLKTLRGARAAALARLPPPLPAPPDTGPARALDERRRGYSAVLASRVGLRDKLAAFDADAARIEGALEGALRELATRGCPTCGKPLGGAIAVGGVCEPSSS